jgi:hypothetical protein
MSLNEVTTAAAWIAGLAIVALIAAGWRKPARATADPARALLRRRRLAGEEVEDTGLELYRRTSWPRRIRAVLGTGFLAVVTGMALATIIGIGVAAAVITITGLLKQ